MDSRSDISTGISNMPYKGSSSGRAPVVKGMQLAAKGPKNKSWEDALAKEDKLTPFVDLTTRAAAADVIAQPAQITVQHPIMLVVAEKISAKLSRDGMVESFEIKGSLTLTANNEENSNCSVQIAIKDENGFAFVTHPKINKPLFDKSNQLQLKDTSKGFPSARPLGILRWSYSSTNDDLIPLKVNCWPEEESRGQMNVSIEYSMDIDKLELHDVIITIPLGTADSPNVVNIDGNYKYNSNSHELVWSIDLIDRSNSSGSLEFNVAQRNADAFFPISVQFSSQVLFCNVEVIGVRGVENGAPIQYGISKSMSTEEYNIE